MTLKAAVVLAIVVSFGMAASPVITSVTPSEGPVVGGMTVLIRGSGFSDNCIICSPPFATPRVHFGLTEAASVEFIDASTLRAVTPPHIPGVVSITVSQHDGSDPNNFTMPDAFAYVGDVFDGFDPILFPIFSPPVHGQSGSEFRTTARLWNKGLSTVTFYGLDTLCTLIDPPIDPSVQYPLHPRSPTLNLFPECSQAPARLFYVPRGDTSFAASLRVWEVSRQSENHGVEIPVVYRKDFSQESIALLDVPNDPKFRLTLRIYGLNRGTDFVNVTIASSNNQVGVLHQLPLLHSSDPFVPSYTVFTDFPPRAVIDSEELTVLVEVPRGPGGVVIPGSAIWAFITVTNNETQHITTVTPQQE
jgi:hypothetical protein